MAVPNIFGTATAAIPLSQLDTNFATAITLGNTAVYLGNTTTSLGNVTLTNVLISSGNATVSNITANAVTSPAATNLLLQSAGTTAVTIDTSQNVGIGSTSPSGRLELTGSSSIRWEMTTASYVNIFSTNPAKNAYVGIATDASNHVWKLSGSEAMRIDTSGNVGIGTSSPQAKFVTNTNLDGSQAIFTGAQSTTEQTLLFRNQYYTNNSTAGVAAIGWLDTGASGGILTFKTGTNGGGVTNIPTERMRIDSSGNVGIGSSPISSSYRLTVTGGRSAFQSNGDAFGIYVSYNSSTNGYFIGSPSADVLAFSSAGGSERMRIDSSGNLLVGTTSASGRFTVKGAGTTNATSAIYITNSAGAYTLAINDDGTFYTGSSPANAPYNLTTASAANVNVTSAGALQRSTSSLKYKTDVQDATHGLADALKLRAVTYKGKKDGDTVFGGLIAEEVHEAGLTEFVQYAKDGSPDALAYGNMVSLAFKAIQEQQALIVSMRDELDALKAKVGA